MCYLYCLCWGEFVLLDLSWVCMGVYVLSLAVDLLIVAFVVLDWIVDFNLEFG